MASGTPAAQPPNPMDEISPIPWDWDNWSTHLVPLSAIGESFRSQADNLDATVFNAWMVPAELVGEADPK